jgi:NAD(P)H-hydrate epimerase
VVIDALLGTGTRLPLRGALAEILDVVGGNLSTRKDPRPTRLTSLASGFDCGAFDRAFVVGVDGPTGLDYESGELDEMTLSVDLTVTFAYPKRGHFRFPGASALGELVVADIGTDQSLAEDITLEVVTPALMRTWLPKRPLDAHKGTFGKAMVVAGSVNYTGAAYLSGASAARAGAGLVTMALPSAIYDAVAAQLAEATYLLLPHELGVIAEEAARVLIEHLDDYDALLVGPGLGQEKETLDFMATLLEGVEERRAVGFGGGELDQAKGYTLPPLVIDADGLNILSRLEGWPRRLPPDSILTPHPGEMARLMACEIESVQADRVAVAREQSAAWGHVIVLKGAYTVVAAPDGRAVIEPFANPGLATAGTGDVLAGSILSLRAQGLDAFEAAAGGAYLHGLAGEWARKEMGVAGMVAGDVLERLPRAWQCVTIDH